MDWEAQAPALDIAGLSVAYTVGGASRDAIDDVSIQVRPGEAYGLVGESGSGKTTVALAVGRYLPRGGNIVRGSIRVQGSDVMGLGREPLRRLRSSDLSFVYQNPARALNPTLTIASQIEEVFRLNGIERREAMYRSADVLNEVRIPDADRVLSSFPHELSGGMAQRVVIAMAIASRPSVLILDEPTTALDVTIEAEILDLISQLRVSRSMAVLCVSHDLSVVSRTCDRVGILRSGRIVEEGPVGQVLGAPAHPYTAALLRALPQAGQHRRSSRLHTALPNRAVIQTATRLDRVPSGSSRTPKVEAFETETDEHGTNSGVDCAVSGMQKELNRSVGATSSDWAASPAVVIARNLTKTYLRGSGSAVLALAGVDFELEGGEILGVVGESGSGKSTLAKALVGQTTPDKNSEIWVFGKRIFPGRRRRGVSVFQLVEQNPSFALNRRHTVGHILTRSLVKSGRVPRRDIGLHLERVLSEVRLPKSILASRPGRLSGGMQQRVLIARALVANPKILVCDEPTSALDVVSQAAVLNLISDLQRTRGFSCVFVSHDLGVVRYMSDRVLVMHRGQIVEYGDVDRVFSAPRHPYTKGLLSALPNSNTPG